MNRPTSNDRPKLLAIIVGIEEYGIAGATLAEARKEAICVALSLKDNPNYDVEIINLLAPEKPPPADSAGYTYPATHDNIFRTVTEEIANRSADLLFFFWCGHGMLGDNRERRLFVSNANKFSNLNIDVDSLLNFLASDEVRIRKQVLLFDACANWDQSWMSRRQLPASKFSWKRGNQVNEQFVLFSVAKDSTTTFKGSPSVFGAGLLDCLAKEDVNLDEFEVIADKIRQYVLEQMKNGKVRPGAVPVIFKRDWNGSESTENRLIHELIDRAREGEDFASQLSLVSNLYSLTGQEDLLPRGRQLNSFLQIDTQAVSKEEREFLDKAKRAQRKRRCFFTVVVLAAISTAAILISLIYFGVYSTRQTEICSNFASKLLNAPANKSLRPLFDNRSSAGVEDNYLLREVTSLITSLKTKDAVTPNESDYKLEDHRKVARLCYIAYLLGDPNPLYNAFGDIEHPTTRTYLLVEQPIWLTPSQAVDVFDELLTSKPPSPLAVQGSVLSLSEYSLEEIVKTKSNGTPILDRLKEIHAGGVPATSDSAIAWTISQLELSDTPAAKNLDVNSGPDWYIDSAGHKLVKFPKGVEFTMGGDSRSRNSGAAPMHQKRIPRAFAVSSCECTVQQYREFHDEVMRDTSIPAVAKPAPKAGEDAFSPNDNQPVQRVSWIDAAMYCNWLSRKEGLKECYEVKVNPNTTGASTIQVQVPPDVCQRTGYRLPTESEWEFACRGGTKTVRFMGNDKEQVTRFAIVNGAAPGRVSSRYPNGAGLFDMLGNVTEWCHDDYSAYQTGRDLPTDDICREVSDGMRVVRGGSFKYAPDQVLSAARAQLLRNEKRTELGFRVARTLE